MGFEPGNKEGKKFSSENQPEKNGRPKKLPALDELIAEILTDEQEGITAAKAILMKLRNEAIKGNIKAGEILLDRAWGKAKQHIEMSGLIQTQPITGMVFKDDTTIRPEPETTGSL